ncbi:MAG: DUF2254 domain-containing protein [Verrucomicrobiales bacterium]|nr:DUF2254 domain-containing protein [Verrucomicrobiales bacterium]
MKTLFRHLRERLRSSLWVVPGLWMISAIIGGRLMVFLDLTFHEVFEEWFPHLSQSKADGFRSLLTTISSSVLTLAGLVFSATLVALSLASSQFGPRLLRNFIRSRMNQATFGILIGNFVYCIVVLRFMSPEFTPQLSLLVAFIFVLGSLICFVLFAHTIITSLQADQVVADVYQDLEQAVETFFPDALPSNTEEKKAIEKREKWEDPDENVYLPSEKGGYLQAVKYESLVEIAADLDIRMRVLRLPGEFVHQQTDLISLADKFELNEEEKKKILNCFIIGPIRTAEQDFEFFVRQLVEVALRALSPGINDPFTAITCIDFLSEALARIARRRLPRQVYFDVDGKARVAIRPVSFQSLLDTAFLQIRQTGGTRPDIAISLLNGLRSIARATSTEEHQKAVLQHTDWTVQTAKEHLDTEHDLQCVEDRRDQIRKICQA